MDSPSQADDRDDEWANPELVYKKASQLEFIPFVLIPGTPFSDERLNRIQALEQKIRDADDQNQPFRLNLTSTVLKNPLQGSWPVSKKEDDSDTEYILAETEEEWFEWKRRVDEKRSKKKANTTYFDASTRTKDSILKHKSVSSQSKEEGSSQVLANRTPLAEHSVNADILNSLPSQMADVMEWNDNSLEHLLQSTQPLQSPHHCADGPYDLLSTPRRQLISPPDSGQELRLSAPFPDQTTPTRARKSNSSQTQVLVFRKSNQINLGDEAGIARSSSLNSIPITPTSSKKPKSVKNTCMEGVDGSPRPQPSSSRDSPSKEGTGKDYQLSSLDFDLNPAQFSPQHSQIGISFPSPTTTQFLYGSQENPTSGTPVVPENADNYAQELEKQIQVADEEAEFFALGDQYHASTKAARNPWDFESQDDMMGVSQQTRAVSEFIGHDLGSGYGDVSYEALCPAVYVDPYDD